jgi:NAD-dependent deacetylase
VTCPRRSGTFGRLRDADIDGLHQRAGLSDELVVEVLGTICWTRSWERQERRLMAETLARVGAGEEDPSCSVCGETLKSDTISFGRALILEVIGKAMQVSEECDLLLAVGSMLAMYPAACCGPRGEGEWGDGRDRQRRADENGRPSRAVLRGQIGAILPGLMRPA